MNALKLTAFAFAVDAVLYVINGLVLVILWRWFMVPTFGLPPLSLAVAVGILVLVMLLTSTSKPIDNDLGKEVSQRITHGVMTPAIALGVGWIAQLFI